MRALLPLVLLAALSGCGEGEVARPARAAPAPPIPVPDSVSGPRRPGAGGAAAAPEVLRGQTARSLIAAFGKPRLDVQEGKARKLQFAGSACVIDVYLYPRERGEPVATHIDARLKDGGGADPASCMATLRR